MSSQQISTFRPVPTYLPTVLVVEDDPAMNSYLCERFHGETSVGVVRAITLTEAKQLIDTPEIHFSAVIADLFFEASKSDPDDHLSDGLDLLNYCKGVRPAVAQYVYSIFSEKDAEHAKAHELGLSIKSWFQKAWHPPGRRAPDAPWACVERDLIEHSLHQDPFLKDRLEQLGWKEEVPTPVISETIRGALRFAMRTYIQQLETGYQLMRPVEVICTREDSGEVRAHAPRFALASDGVGDTVDEALVDLGETLIDIIEIRKI
jgi:hypothetical protein